METIYNVHEDNTKHVDLGYHAAKTEKAPVCHACVHRRLLYVVHVCTYMIAQFIVLCMGEAEVTRRNDFLLVVQWQNMQRSDIRLSLTAHHGMYM